jgi:hypothetical protein
MLAIVRVKIKLKETTSRGVVSLQTANMDRVWRRIVREHSKWNGKNARVAYLTHRSLQEDVSVILDAKSMDAVADFVLKHIASMKEAAGIRVMPLMLPRFFRVPKGMTSQMKRYTTSIKVDPNELDNVYEYLSGLIPSKAIAPVYLACALNGFGRDLMFSFLCPGETTAKKFVSTYIIPCKGILDTRTTLISHSKRLIEKEDWLAIIKKHSYEKGVTEIDDIEVFEEDWFGAC